jgi:hypothetical protein
MVSWCSSKQTYVALSTTETEYIAVCSVASHTPFMIVWPNVGSHGDTL